MRGAVTTRQVPGGARDAGCRARRPTIALAAGLLILGGAGAFAQDAPPAASSVDLTVPPDLRGGPSRSLAMAHHKSPHAPVARRVAPSAATDAAPKAAPGTPVGFGLHVQGGSNESRFNSATSAAADSQGAGNGVAAGVTFGF